MPRSFRAVLVVLVALVTSWIGHAAPGDDPAARGVDVFVHAPDLAPGGGTVEVLVEAFGFPAVTTMVPLGGAEIEAAWDPEHLGEVSAAPPSVRAVADATGRASLSIP